MRGALQFLSSCFEGTKDEELARVLQWHIAAYQS